MFLVALSGERHFESKGERDWERSRVAASSPTSLGISKADTGLDQGPDEHDRTTSAIILSSHHEKEKRLFCYTRSEGRLIFSSVPSGGGARSLPSSAGPHSLSSRAPITHHCCS
jgi:hypothetical protein